MTPVEVMQGDSPIVLGLPHTGTWVPDEIWADLNDEGVTVVLSTHDLNGMAAHLPHLVCVNGRIVADGAPADVITPDVLERTFGKSLEVLQHLGMPVVIDDYDSRSRIGEAS